MQLDGWTFSEAAFLNEKAHQETKLEYNSTTKEGEMVYG